VPVEVVVMREGSRVVIRIFDSGSGPDEGAVGVPDLDAKLAGTQSPRGWGLFLIEQMVDALRHDVVDGRHLIELEMSLEGAS
jgi:anti-sigma regulatory factor (Ser/Thr protein kinase)